MSEPILLNESRFNYFPKLLWKRKAKMGVEIGVSTGRYSKVLCHYNPHMKLYCIDPWKAYSDYVEQHDEEGQKQLDLNYARAKERLAPYNCTLMKLESMEALDYFEDESLDFVFIDGNHTFEYVIEDIAKWSKKVKKGGIISGHDYWNGRDGTIKLKGLTKEQQMKLCQVKDAVDAWTKTNEIKEWYVLIKDKCPTWYWVKQ